MSRAFALVFSIAIGCTPFRRDDGSGGDNVEAKSPAGATCATRQELSGVVIYDPHFQTLVHPPHRGTFVAPSVKVGDAVAPRAPLAEVVWGPNRGKILAPVAGVVVHAGAAIGSYVRESDAPFVIADPTRLAVRVESASGTFRNATPAELFLEGVTEPIVAPASVRDGTSLIVTLPVGFAVKVGTAARLAFECSS